VKANQKRHSREGGLAAQAASVLKLAQCLRIEPVRAMASKRVFWPADAGHWIPAFAGMTLGFLLLLCACAVAPTHPAPEKLSLSPVEFADLPEWNADHVSEAVPALLHSCHALTHRSPQAVPDIAGKASDWTAPCAALASLPPGDDAAASAFFENAFRPYAVAGNNGGEGLFTGYYEAELHGSSHRHGRFQTPLYARPRDLITADLGDFRPEWKGRHIAGKVEGTRLEPYDDREKIVRGSLKKRAEILLWVDDPVDAFFLAVQGSGRVRMTDGRIVRVGYDGANGQSYVAIGHVLADMGALKQPITMQSIRAWLNAHPEHADAVMNENPSYVFFRVLKTDQPIGAQGVPLTPRRSLAVDSSFLPLGVPLWLDTSDGKDAPLRRVVVAQDTGGAIKGPVRGDFFWGFGKDAEAEAGAMQSPGHYYVLLPKTVTPNAAR
jgi:membrane-bound lytic murein transglycosylase A